MALKDRKCVPCGAGTLPLTPGQARAYLGQLEGWRLRDGRIRKELRFPDFVTAMEFVDRLAKLAEREGHHPDFCVHYNHVELSLWTHAIGGLSENDFIVASKIDELL